MDKAAIQGDVPSPAEPVPDEFDLVCEYCGYSLVGLMHTNVCPECGKEFDPKQLPLARVPWLFRRRRGTISTYLETVREILFHPRAIAAELCRPVRVSPPDARLFRRVTIWIATISAVLVVIAAFARFMFDWRQGFTRPDVEEVVVMGLFSAIGCATVHLFLLLATDMPTFIWRGLDNNPLNLTPLHHYACAPLALFMPLLSVCGLVAVAFEPMSGILQILAAIAVGISLMLGLWMWALAVAFMNIATHCSVRRSLALMLYLPFHWLVMFLVTFGGAAVLIEQIAEALEKWR